MQVVRQGDSWRADTPTSRTLKSHDPQTNAFRIALTHLNPYSKASWSSLPRKTRPPRTKCNDIDRSSRALAPVDSHDTSDARCQSLRSVFPLSPIRRLLFRGTLHCRTTITLLNRPSPSLFRSKYGRSGFRPKRPHAHSRVRIGHYHDLDGAHSAISSSCVIYYGMR